MGWNKLGLRFLDTLKRTPVELVAALVYWLIAVWMYKGFIATNEFAWTFPISFFFIYAVNRYTVSSKLRPAYFGSAVIILLCWFWQWETGDMSFWISVFITQLLVLYSQKSWANESFVAYGWNYLKNLAASLVLTTIGWLISMAIYASVVYIFDLFNNTSSFSFYSALTAYVLVAPALFLMLDIQAKEFFAGGRFVDILMNIILTPALMIYTLVLYAYFIKIGVSWTLPKGGIAYMVLSYIGVMLLVKSIQPFLSKRYYNWFYGHSSWWCLLPLGMLGVSLGYRIMEYGFTEMRVYLLLVSLIAAFATGLFFFCKKGRYAWILLVAGILLAVFTYIPGINAESLGLKAQWKRIERLASELKLRGEDGKLLPVTRQAGYTPEEIRQYKSFYDIFSYLKHHEKEEVLSARLGITTREELLNTLFPAALRERIFYSEGYISPKIYLNNQESELLEISTFSRFQEVRYWGKNALEADYRFGELVLEQGDSTILTIEIKPWFEQQLQKAGIDSTRVLTRELLEEQLPLFMILDTEEARLVLSTLDVDPDKREVEDIRVNYVFWR